MSRDLVLVGKLGPLWSHDGRLSYVRFDDELGYAIISNYPNNDRQGALDSAIGSMERWNQKQRH